jgi:hypothetical protein
LKFHAIWSQKSFWWKCCGLSVAFAAPARALRQSVHHFARPGLKCGELNDI